MAAKWLVPMLAATWLLLPAAAECQQPSDTFRSAAEMELKVKNAVADLTVPESPAFAALGLSPETIIRPATPREFATALLNGVDRSGHVQTGLAIDVAPYLVYAGSRVTLSDYRASRVTQVLSHTTASFATTKASSDEDKTVRLALGVHATLYDSEDPRLDNDQLLNCYADMPVFRPLVLPVSPDLTVRAQQERQLAEDRRTFETSVLIPGVEACRTKFQRNARWNGTSWIVAVAPTWIAPTGLAGDLDGGSLAAWTSLSYGFDSVPGLQNNAQVTGHFRHLSNELVTDAALAGGKETRETTIAGVRFRAGTTGFGLSFEASYIRTAAAGRADDTSSRLAFGADRRLADNLWLTLSMGGDHGVSAGTPSGLSMLGALKFGLSKDPSITDEQLRKLIAAPK